MPSGSAGKNAESRLLVYCRIKLLEFAAAEISSDS